MKDEVGRTRSRQRADRWREIGEESKSAASEIIDEVQRRVRAEAEQSKKIKEEEELQESECQICLRKVCVSNPECWDCVILDCEFCHGGCLDDDFPGKSFDRLEKLIEEFELNGGDEPWKISDLYSGMIRWTERYDRENQDRIRIMLDKKKESEKGRPESRRKSEKLGRINSRKIRWIRTNESEESPEIFSLLEENLALSTSSGDYLSQAMSLNQMVTWITQNDPGRIDECDEFWEMQLIADKKKFTAGLVDSNLSEKITLRNMVIWYSKYRPENEKRIYKLVQRLWNLVKDDDLVEKSIALRVASYTPSKKGWSGELRPFIYRRALELVKTTDDPKAMMQLNITLRNIESEIPESILRGWKTNDNLDSLLVSLIELSSGNRSGFTPIGDIIEDDESEVQLFTHRDFTNVSVIQIRGGVPTPDYDNIERDSLVLDIPNIMRRRIENHEDEDHQKKLFSQIVECIQTRDYQLDKCWMYVSYGLISDYPQLIRHMLDDVRFNLLFSMLDPGIDEDWSFLTFAMINGHKVVSNDWFRKETSIFPEIVNFLNLAKLNFTWDVDSNSIEIGQRRMFRIGSDQASLANNRMTGIVVNYFGELSSLIADRGISVSPGDGHLSVKIVAKKESEISMLIGKGGRKVRGLQNMLMERLGVQNPDQIVIHFESL